MQSRSCVWTCVRIWACVAHMTEQSNDHIRRLFTEVGCIMEDANFIALVWNDISSSSIEDRYNQLLAANGKVDALLKSIKSAVESD